MPTTEAKKKPWGGGTALRTGEAMKEETARVEALYAKLRIEKERVRALAESVGLGVNGVLRSGSASGPHWAHGAAAGGADKAVRGTRDLLSLRKQAQAQGGSSVNPLADLQHNTRGPPPGGAKKGLPLSPTRLKALAEASMAGRGSGVSAVRGAAAAGASSGGGSGSGSGSGAASPTRASPAAAAALLPSAAAWGVGDVCAWLGKQGLGEYAPLFEKHDIGGAALLEVSASDLDYMGIVPLGHRKALLRGVVALRAGSEAGGRTPSKDAAAAAEAGRVHWASLPPLAASPSSSSSSGSLLQGEVNEEEEREAFKAAVMAWRRGGKPEDSSSAGSSAGGGAGGGGAEGLWVNPFGATSEPANAGGQGGGSLLQGSYDEEAEAKAFAAAVAEWRAGGAGAQGSSSADAPPGAFGVAPTARCACYQCFRVFIADTGYSCTPEVAGAGGGGAGAGAGAAAADARLAAKAFCSRACFSSALSALQERDRAQEAARSAAVEAQALAAQAALAQGEAGMAGGEGAFDLLAAAASAGEALFQVEAPPSPAPAAGVAVEAVEAGAVAEGALDDLTSAAEAAAGALS